ncbi:unnamed protein product [Ceratitis capitata]|uniref:(Mediterranean fruit fly) hypothetical protein n=2 Tax=Ceratitis capitata TaxID=7213 RepID=A0A811VJN3_CERCA|nr:unnamed protein product [Ceratitis capitata]
MAAVENKDCQNDKNQTFAITKSYHQELNRSPAVQQHQHKYSNPPLNLNEKYSGHEAEEKEMPAFVGFATASNKTITISKEAETKAAKILEQLPPISPSEEINITKQISMHTAPKEEYIFKGFCTASSKEIKISKEAQERALKLLEQLPDLEVKEEQDMHKMTGFRTASRKTVQMSEDAKKRAALIMKEVMDFDVNNVEHNAEECLDNIQFSEWPVEEKEVQGDVVKIDAKSSDMKIGSDANMPGFSTASNKTIKISEAAMQRAAGILEDLPELSTDEVIKCPNTAKNMDTETLQNMMFSEWPLDDVVGDALDKHEAPPNGMHKRKRNNSDNPATHDAVQAHSPQTPKFICTSPSKERSPLTNIQTAVARSSLSELAIKTPPDYRACRGIISRKNLLSLNKRNKLSAKSLQQNKEFKDDCSAVSTPKNRRRRSITSIGNDIKSPPGTPIPNLQEFFQSATVSTSTPHPPAREQTQMRTRGRKRTELQLAALNSSTKDVSFKRIEWENESLNKTAASLNASRLSNSSFSNIIKMELNPTPKQRIERLRMYGKPPSVSPILMSSTNNCRISGLKRRTRSANKVDEVNKE